MATNVIMPKAGMAMEEGTILQWFKKEGEKIESGDPLLEIETDKVNMEVESPATGVLLKILYQEGDVIPVTMTIGYIGEPGEKIEDTAPVAATPAAKTELVDEKVDQEEMPIALSAQGERVAATPAAKRIAAEKGVDLTTVTPSGSQGEVKARDVENIQAIAATPLARKMAQDMQIDLGAIQGTGIDGKITKEDVQAASQTPAATTRPITPLGEVIRKPLRGMRKTIAQRMLQSHLQAPPVTQQSKADITELVTIRKRLNEALADDGVKITFNDLVLKVTAIALSEHPEMNVAVDGDELIYYPYVNLGMAVALKEGLIVPVIKNADQLSLKEISIKTKGLALKARDGKLQPDEYTGGTFTVSNMGSFDIVAFTPILNPPEAGILGVCTIENELKMIDGQIETRSIMGLSLTFDHRAIDGSQCAIFQKRIKALLENPVELMAY